MWEGVNIGDDSGGTGSVGCSLFFVFDWCITGLGSLIQLTHCRLSVSLHHSLSPSHSFKTCHVAIVELAIRRFQGDCYWQYGGFFSFLCIQKSLCDWQNPSRALCSQTLFQKELTAMIVCQILHIAQRHLSLEVQRRLNVWWDTNRQLTDLFLCRWASV